MDCDSSQAAAIEEVRGGRNLVIQGPPGTGKSQSIANIIAAAVRDGRTVLFVAEKLAALQVVKSRLDRVGLGDICLELHSHKANRRSVLDDLERTLDLGRPANQNLERQAAELGRTRGKLNRYVQQLHSPIEPCRRTPYELIGSLCRLQADGITPFKCAIPEIETWSATTLHDKRRLIENIVEHIAESGVPDENVWRGVRKTVPLLPSELQSLQQPLNSLHNDVERILEGAKTVLKMFLSPDYQKEGLQQAGEEQLLHGNPSTAEQLGQRLVENLYANLSILDPTLDSRQV